MIGSDKNRSWLKHPGLNDMGKSDPPAAPDYTAAANATAQGNLDAARVAAKANRVSQYTPYGNLEYYNPTKNEFDQRGYDSAMTDYQKRLDDYNAQPTTGGFTWGNRATVGGTSGPAPTAPNREDYMHGYDPDMWASKVTLSPDQQALLDQQNKISLGLNTTMDKGLGYVNDMLANPFDTGKLPAEQINAGQTAQDAIMSRLQPQFDRRQSQLEQQLANQGIARGTEAWGNAQKDLDYARNDAYTQAALQGMGIGQQARQQSLQEQAYLRNEPLNTLNAVRTGAQVTNPQFTNAPQQQTTAGPDLLGAANANYQGQLSAYNANQASNSGLMGGLFNIGSSFAGSPTGAAALSSFFSDRRLKSNIERIGTHDKYDIGIYSYEKFGIPEIGYMADEVQKVIPEAVTVHASGYKMVDYSKVV